MQYIIRLWDDYKIETDMPYEEVCELCNEGGIDVVFKLNSDNWVDGSTEAFEVFKHTEVI